jgi:hypothetical protein
MLSNIIGKIDAMEISVDYPFRDGNIKNAVN